LTSFYPIFWTNASSPASRSIISAIPPTPFHLAVAQPFRMLAHNGEINTLAGNVNWMKSHETAWGEVFGRRLPI
jgi:hypothetical protein